MVGQLQVPDWDTFSGRDGFRAFVALCARLARALAPGCEIEMRGLDGPARGGFVVRERDRLWACEARGRGGRDGFRAFVALCAR